MHDECALLKGHTAAERPGLTFEMVNVGNAAELTSSVASTLSISRAAISESALCRVDTPPQKQAKMAGVTCLLRSCNGLISPTSSFFFYLLLIVDFSREGMEHALLFSLLFFFVAADESLLRSDD